MKILIKIDDVLAKVQEYACYILLMAMVVLGGIQVFGRYLFGFAPAWTEELMRYCMIYLGFISICLTARHDGHISMDFLQETVKNNKVRMALYIITRVICLVFVAVVIPGGFDLITKSVKSLGSSVPISWSYIYAAVPVGFIMLFITLLARLPGFATQVGKGEK